MSEDRDRIAQNDEDEQDDVEAHRLANRLSERLPSQSEEGEGADVEAHRLPND